MNTIRSNRNSHADAVETVVGSRALDPWGAAR